MRNKKISWILIILLSFVGTVAHAKKIKIATIVPDGTTWMQELRAAAKEISQQTQGRVDIKFYPGGVMGSDEAVLRKIRIGQLHGGAVTGGAIASIFPDAQIYSLPFMFKSIEEVNYVRSKLDQKIIKDFEKHGFVNLGISNGGFAYMFSKEPVGAVANLKNQKVWIPQGDLVGQLTFEAAGISPVQLAMPDVYTGLQTGLLDTVVANTTGVIAFQWHTKIKNMTDVPMIFLVGMVLVDKKVFDKLQANDQKVVRKIMRDAFARIDAASSKDDVSSRAALLKQGIEFIKPTREEQAVWQGIAESALSELGKRKAYSAGYLNALKKHLSDFRN